MYNSYNPDTEIADPQDRGEYKYWFIGTITPETGTPIVLGEYNDESEAYRVGMQKMLGQYEVFGMPTKDRAKATQRYKYMIFEKTSNIEKSIKRAKHYI